MARSYYDVNAVQDYIRAAALRRGMDPVIALRVAKSEGLAPGTWQSNYRKNGRRETSYGPYQLLVGGGLGDQFKAQTGFDPTDPGTVYAQVDFALDHAKNNGWGSWYGARNVGIGNWDGIGGTAPAGGSPPPVPPQPKLQPTDMPPPSLAGIGSPNTPMAQPQQMITDAPFPPAPAAPPQGAVDNSKLAGISGLLSMMSKEREQQPLQIQQPEVHRPQFNGLPQVLSLLAPKQRRWSV